MNLKGSFIIAVLASGLLFSSVAAANEPVKRSTDEQGTIRINTPSKQEKAEEKAGEPKAGPEATKTAPAPQEPPPPGLMPSHSRRGGPTAAASRRKAFEQSHPNLAPKKPAKETPENPAPAPTGAKEPPASGQPENPPEPESR